MRQIGLGVPADRRGYPRAVIILGIAFLLATAWTIYILHTTPSEALWGFLVTNFIFLLGVSQFGVAFTAIMRICKANFARSFYRLAELTTLAFLPFAIIGFVYIYIYGSPHLFYWLNASQDAHLSPWLNQTFLLYRNLLAQLVFYFIAIVYFLMGLLPDISAENSGAGPIWRQKFYQCLLSMKKNKDEAALKRNVYLYSPIVLVAAVIANTFIAWDFGMMLVPHYHSTVFPMFYILGNMFAGSAALVFLAVLLSRIIPVASYFQTTQVHSMAVLLTAFTLLWMYLFWAQFFVSWYGNLPHEYGVLARQMYGHYAPFFWVMMLCNFIIPISCLIFLKLKQTWWAMVLLAIIINTGIWLNRYLIVVPALVDDHYPLTSIPEITMTVGLFAGFFFVLLLFFNIFPMVSMWEVRAVENDKVV